MLSFKLGPQLIQYLRHSRCAIVSLRVVPGCSGIRTALLFHFALSLGAHPFVGIYQFSHSSPSSLLGANH